MGRIVPELVAPAGTLGKMRYAFAYGADAVYAGGTAFSMRARAGNFSLEEMASGIAEAHALGRRFYLTANTLLRESALAECHAFLADALALGPDALILADPGLLVWARRHFPAIPVHLSTQANVLNSGTLAFWRDLGVARVVLARELALDEIARIRERTEGIALEAFVHGALCIAYAGRCLLSSYLTGTSFRHPEEVPPPDLVAARWREGVAAREANQGDCSQSCRWVYRLWEEKRGAPVLEAVEEGDGTYLLAAHDLSMIRHLDELARAGVDAFKIEGRVKSLLYVASVTRAYRAALDDLSDWEQSDAAHGPEREAEVAGLTKRALSTGWYFPENRATAGGREGFRFLGEVLAPVPGGFRCRASNCLRPGERIDALGPAGRCFSGIAFRLAALDASELLLVPHGAEFLLLTDTPLAPLDILYRPMGPEKFAPPLSTSLYFPDIP
jgi:putative protease